MDDITIRRVGKGLGNGNGKLNPIIQIIAEHLKVEGVKFDIIPNAYSGDRDLLTIKGPKKALRELNSIFNSQKV